MQGDLNVLLPYRNQALCSALTLARPYESDPLMKALSGLTPLTGGLAAAIVRGEAAKEAWVADGSVVSDQALADAWQVQPAFIGQAAQRGELCELLIGGQAYYPAVFMHLDPLVVAKVSLQLNALGASEQFIFWQRKHGALGGRTAPEALTDEPQQLAPVMKLAQQLTAHSGRSC